MGGERHASQKTSREHRERQQHTEHTREQRAHVHVGACRARETKRADGDGEGEDCPEERNQWEREEAREQREVTPFTMGANAEILALKNGGREAKY